MWLQQWLRTLHGWLGVLVLPWVVVIGFTGFYLNHRDLVGGAFPETAIDVAAFAKAADHVAADPAYALRVALALHPDAGFTDADVQEDEYLGEPFYVLEGRRIEVIVQKASGYHFDKTSRERVTYNPKGEVVGRKTFWTGYFKEIHERGWVGNRFGTWLADIAAVAMIAFGLSGLYLFFYPRIRRWRS